MAKQDIDITHLLKRWSEGDRQAFEMLVPQVYEELRRIARAHVAREAPGHTLEPTALAHEAFMVLVDREQVDWQDRAHFFRLAAHVMRCILVDYARRRRTAKRGGGLPHVPLEEAFFVPVPKDLDLVALDDALEELAALDPEALKVVELRFFMGLSHEEVAEILTKSPRTVRRKWVTAKLWLYQRVKKT